MSSAASGFNFMPNLMIPRAPKPGAQVPDLIRFAQGIASALEHFRVLLESQTESFISSSAYIGDLVVANGHVQDLAVTTAKINDLTVTTLKRQLTNVVFVGYTASANSDAYTSIATGVNGSVINARVFPMNLQQGWSGASTSQTYFGLLYEAATDDYYANLHNGTNTFIDFSVYLEWW